MFNGENELDKVIKRSNQPSSSAKLVPYCTIDDEFEIMNTVGKNKIVHFEKPSKIYGFKVADIDLDKILILNREGFENEIILLALCPFKIILLSFLILFDIFFGQLKSFLFLIKLLYAGYFKYLLYNSFILLKLFFLYLFFFFPLYPTK